MKNGGFGLTHGPHSVIIFPTRMPAPFVPPAPQTPADAPGREKLAAARWSVAAGVFLVIAKLGVGFSIGSVAVLSEAAHSATDLLAAVIAFWAVRAADAPPDFEHPYGHGKFESLSGIMEAVLILAAGVFIVIEAVLALRGGHGSSAPLWGVAVMAASAIVNGAVAAHLRFVAHKTDSLALRADASHLMTDVYTSVGVTLGLGLAYFTGKPWLDPLAALVVAGFVLRTAFVIAREAAGPLIDGKLPDEEIARVEAILRDDVTVLSWHKLRTRKSGSQRHIDVHIQVDDALSLREAHRVTEDLEDKMREALPNVQVMIHTEPFEEEMRHHEEVPH